MENWFVDEEWLVKKGERYILDHYLKYPYKLLNAMICRLYSEETNTHFRMEWFLMVYTIVKTGKSFSWSISYHSSYQLEIRRIKVCKVLDST